MGLHTVPTGDAGQLLVFPWGLRAQARWGQQGELLGRWLGSEPQLLAHVDMPLLEQLQALDAQLRQQLLTLTSGRLRVGDHPATVARALRSAAVGAGWSQGRRR